MPKSHGYKLSQVNDSSGQGFIALIRNGEIVGRFMSWDAARVAYRAAVKVAK